MRKTLFLASLVLLSACVAETIERRKPRKGPVKAVGFIDFGGGNVRYSPDGWGWFVAGRRRHAQRLMRRNCGKELVPQITDEYSHQDADIAYAGEDIKTSLDAGMDHFKIAPFQHIIYICRAPNEPYAPPKVSTASPVMVIPSVAVSTVPAPSQEPPK